MKFKKGMVVCTRYSHMNTEIIYSEKYKGVRAQRKKIQENLCEWKKSLPRDKKNVFKYGRNIFPSKYIFFWEMNEGLFNHEAFSLNTLKII